MSRVFYESWQVHCCGDSFAVGDDITWTVTPIDETSRTRLAQVTTESIDWVEDHHEQGVSLISVSGTVQRIRVVWAHAELVDESSRFHEVVPESQVAGDVARVTRVDAKGPGPGAGLITLGYLVSLDPLRPGVESGT